MWPFAVFFRAMKAKYDAAPDERIPTALARYFLLYSKEHVFECRNVVNVEGILWAYSHTGDKKLLKLAEKAWCMRKPLPPESKNELAPKNCVNNDAIHMHGVSYCEEMKVPMLLAAYTGKEEYLEQAVNVERKLVRDQSFDFGGFRREVESLVNDSASPSER